MRDDFTTKERTGAGTGEVLARLGYALVGALVAVLVSAMMSLVPWPADDTLFPVYVNASVMGATLMLWASFKPSRGSAGAVAAEALTVFVTVLVVQMVGSCLQSPSLFGLYPNPLSWVWDHAIFMLYSGLALVLPISWALGSNERWARRSFKRVLGELAFVLAAWALAASGVLDSAHSLIGFMVQGLVFVASALATAGGVPAAGVRTGRALPCGRGAVCAPAETCAARFRAPASRAAREPACGVHRVARRIGGRQRVRARILLRLPEAGGGSGFGAALPQRQDPDGGGPGDRHQSGTGEPAGKGGAGAVPPDDMTKRRCLDTAAFR